MENYREKLRCLQQMIDRSQYLVCLMGVWVSSECGCTNYRDEKDSYKIEQKYGYSPDEMFNTGFFHTRPQRFYEFYKNDMVNFVGEIGPGLMTLKKLEEQGKLKAIITRDIFSLAKRAGCQNVHELHGSVFDNYCQHCGKYYPLEYVLESKGIPKCDVCGSMIRPGVSMVGEMVDNSRISMAAQEVRQADTLMVLGSSLKSALSSMFLRDFQGRNLILLNSNAYLGDSQADLVIHGKPMDILKDLGI